ncbi:MAG: nucleotidyltransferase family protein [Thermoanaerobaculia bacterium]
MQTLECGDTIPDDKRAFYERCIDILREAELEFLVGGAYAIELYTGLRRPTKDFDIFMQREDIERALAMLDAHGYRAEFTYPHWLAKAFDGEHFIDIIHSSGNGVAPVDDVWFEYARTGIVFDRPVLLCPPEESIWSKAFIMERERYDGADIAHLIESRGPELDWRRLLQRFGPHWRVLFAHLILVGYIYPSRRDVVPAWLMRTLCERLAAEVNDAPVPHEVCRGTVLSRAQYLADLAAGEFADGRLAPWGLMTTEDIEHWTRAIEKEK